MIDAFRMIIGAGPIPEWISAAMEDKLIRPPMERPPVNGWALDGMLVSTPVGEQHAMPGDWVIRDDGWLYVVKAADFEGTYMNMTDKRVLTGTRADWMILDDPLG